MSSSKIANDVDAVTVEVEVAAPPERVFQALTDPTQVLAWWGQEPSVELSLCEMDARPGGRWRFRWRPSPGTEKGAIYEQLRQNGAAEYEAHGEVLDYMPPRLLVWSWIANWHADPKHPTVVRWELSPTRTGTHVRVTHSGLSQESVARKDYDSGWAGVLKLLGTFFERP
jgi:uncharacterized protein YndB with AHSA1/START domain